MSKHTISLLSLASSAVLFAACAIEPTDSEGRAAAAVESDAAVCEGLEGLGSYDGYFGDLDSGPFIQTEDISCADALANCELNAAANPSLSVTCTWDGVVIFANEASSDDCEDSAGQPVCGLFRGGLSEADNMIASPNPPESIEDTDEACMAYCDASNPVLGDECARGGNVIKTY